MSLARKIFAILLQDSNTAPHYLTLTLTDPQGVWTTLLLQERYRLTSKCLELSHVKSWQDQIAACQNWLKLLQSSLPSEKLHDLKHIMRKIKQDADPATADPRLKSTCQRLDLCNDLANHLSFEDISPHGSIK